VTDGPEKQIGEDARSGPSVKLFTDKQLAEQSRAVDEQI